MTLFAHFSGVIAAWNARDIERALAGMDDAVTWHVAAGALPPLRGKAAVRTFLTRLAADTTETDWRIHAHAETGSRLFVEGVDAYVRGNGVAVAMPYAAVIDYADGLIVGWRDYVDTRRMEKLREGAAPPAFLAALLQTA